MVAADMVTNRPFLLPLEKWRSHGKISPLDGIGGDFMEQETEVKTDEYYILFRDTKDPKPIDYAARCLQQDLLIGDKASYVWSYVGNLDSNQAREVQARLDLEFGEKFQKEREPSAINFDEIPVAKLNNKNDFVWYNRDTKQARREIQKLVLVNKIFVVPYQPAALDFLAQISPNLAFLSIVPPNYKVRIYPESAEEEERIIEELKRRPAKARRYFKFWLFPRKKESINRHRSFVELFSLETLVNMWGIFGHHPPAELLRRAAGILVIKTLENDRVHPLGRGYNTEKIKRSFNLRVISKGYISTLTSRQLEVFWKCVDIVQSIRTEDGYEDQFENKYEALATKYEEDLRITLGNKRVKLEKMSVRLESIKVEREKTRVAHEKARVAYEKARVAYEESKVEHEAMGGTVDDLPLYPPLTQTVDQDVPAADINENSTAPIAKPGKLLVVSEATSGDDPVHRKDTAKVESANDTQADKQPEGQSAPSVSINELPAAPTEEPEQPPIVPEPVAETRIDEQEEEQEDIADIVARLKGRWVSPRDFLDRKINANRGNFTERDLLGNREKNNTIKWSKNKPAIGRDKDGNFLERSGKNRWNYRYRYFLLKEFDLEPSPTVPDDLPHVPNGK